MDITRGPLDPEQCCLATCFWPPSFVERPLRPVHERLQAYVATIRKWLGYIEQCDDKEALRVGEHDALVLVWAAHQREMVIAAYATLRAGNELEARRLMHDTLLQPPIEVVRAQYGELATDRLIAFRAAYAVAAVYRATCNLRHCREVTDEELLCFYAALTVSE